MDAYIKIVLVGDGAVGKSCLLCTYVTGEFPLVCAPIMFDNLKANIIVDDQQCSLRFWDTSGTCVVAGEGLTVDETLFVSGMEDFDRLRPLSYPFTDVLVLCFSLVDCSSYKNIESKVCVSQLVTVEQSVALSTSMISILHSGIQNCSTIVLMYL